MMNFYRVVTTVYYKDREMRSRYGKFLSEEEQHNSVTKITWDNINDLYKYATCDMRTCKKGRLLHVWGNPDNFKEWKQPDLTFEVKTSYTIITPSIKTILDYHDGEAAIKYLLERGMNVIAAG